MERPGDYFPPTLSFQQPIDRGLMDFFPETAFQSLLDFGNGSDLTGKSRLSEGF